MKLCIVWNHLKHLAVDRRIILKWILRDRGGEGVVDWIHLAQG